VSPLRPLRPLRVSETRVKICCIANLDEARLADRHGAWAVGLVSDMPSGPGVIPEERIVEIAEALPPHLESFLLTCRTDPRAIAAQHRRCRTTTIQLCDRLPPGAHARLRDAVPHVRLVQVVHVAGEESVQEAGALAGQVDAILLDSGRPNLAVKELGGTGRVHDWEISRAIAQAAAVPVILAGGLRAENVGAAIDAVRPYALDVCTGVRTNGALDEQKLSDLMREVRAVPL
jgi:phosphoribosylanthranilate isomerase